MLFNIPINTKIVTEDGFMQDILRRWIFGVTKLSTLTGVGTPEGVVEAAQTQEYMDTAGTAGNIKYIKRDADIAGDSTRGWILI